MTTMEDICDPRRTAPAAISSGQTHKVFRKRYQIVRACDERVVSFPNLLLVKQRPEEITCSVCRMLEEKEHGH